MDNKNDTVEQVCEGLRAGNMGWLADRILAAHKREIAELKANYELERFSVNKSIDEIANRNALIKELADALEREITYNNKADCIYADKCCCNDCTYQYCDHKKNSPLLKKAREMVK